jgi:hypothetical protein
MFLRHLNLKLDVYELRVAQHDVTWLKHVNKFKSDGALKCVIS